MNKELFDMASEKAEKDSTICIELGDDFSKLIWNAQGKLRDANDNRKVSDRTAEFHVYYVYCLHRYGRDREPDFNSDQLRHMYEVTFAVRKLSEGFAKLLNETDEGVIVREHEEILFKMGNHISKRCEYIMRSAEGNNLEHEHGVKERMRA